MKNIKDQFGLYIYKKLVPNTPLNNSICIKHLDGSNHYNVFSDIGISDEDLKNL